MTMVVADLHGLRSALKVASEHANQRISMRVCNVRYSAATGRFRRRLRLGWMLDLMWVVSSKDRTQYLIELIREARSSRAPTRK